MCRELDSPHEGIEDPPGSVGKAGARVRIEVLAPTGSLRARSILRCAKGTACELGTQYLSGTVEPAKGESRDARSAYYQRSFFVRKYVRSAGGKGAHRSGTVTSRPRAS